MATLVCACAVLVAAASAAASSGGVDPDSGGETTQPPPPPPPPPPDGNKRKLFFPVRGPHTYGDGFGAPRDGYAHQGQDIAAPCKTKLVSVRAGVVKVIDYQPERAGWYVVIDNDRSGKDFAYMHLKKRISVRLGQHVKAGRKIGMVGKTGSATGCHLHFEIWQGAWREGGSKPIDPLPKLERWDRN